MEGYGFDGESGILINNNVNCSEAFKNKAGPVLTIQINGGMTIKLPWSAYLTDYSDSVCMGLFFKANSMASDSFVGPRMDQYIIGSAWLSYFNMAFNMDSGSLGLALSNYGKYASVSISSSSNPGNDGSKGLSTIGIILIVVGCILIFSLAIWGLTKKCNGKKESGASSGGSN